MKRKFLPLLLTVVLVAAAIVPMLTLTAAAETQDLVLDFTNSANCEEIDANQQVWKQNDITLTNNKTSSSTAVNKYVPSTAGHARFYKSSDITIECKGMSKIVFDCTGSKYASAPTNLTGATAATSGTTLTITLASPVDSFTFNCNGSQLRVKKITVTCVVAAGECTHEWDEGVETTSATCTEAGEMTYTCSLCSETKTENIKALGHDWEITESVDPTCTTLGSISKECTTCGETTEESVGMTPHNYVDGTCDVCGAEKPVTPDYSGRYYIAAIRSSGNYFWMTSDLGTAKTKRYQAVDYGLANLLDKISSPEKEYVFVLEKNDDDTYSIYAEGVKGDNYLGWTSGNSGTLVAKESALKLTVEVTEGGLYNIHFTGDVKRYLALNDTSGNNYFAWYKSGQKQNLTLVPVDGEIVDIVNPMFTGTSLALGTDFTVNYYVQLPSVVADYKVVFDFNNESKEVDISSAKIVNGEYVFSLTGIGPQNYQDNIVAKLVYNGNTIINTKDTYSVEASLTGYINGNYNDETKALAEATLAYCAAAKAFVSSDITSTENDRLKADIPDSANNRKLVGTNTKVKAVGVNFDYVNKIYVKLNADATVTFNGVAADVVDLGNGVYIAYSDALTALQFNDTVTIVVDNTTTVTYSVNAYAFAKQNADNVEMANLAITLYNYGVAAKAYKTAQSAN